MAKKQTKAPYQGDPGDEHIEKVAPIIKEKPLPTPVKNSWEFKNRGYKLRGSKKPLSYTIKTRGLYWFDEEKGYEREIKYCENQRTVFVDEMKGPELMGHIVFRMGVLMVPKEKTVLQKFLSLYHPSKDKIFEEVKPQEDAQHDVDVLELEVDALVAAKTLDIDQMESIMRTEIGSKVSSMSSRELKRDCLLFARNNPILFLDLINDDNIQLRNVGIKATEAGILMLSSDNRTFTWASNNRKLMNVPFDEHPYSALAAWFKTDEGMEILGSIEKRLNN
tara:strand:- start:5105 stop:5938 length:834 start_codon:yes stop_codon:yes gene_type:complete